VVFAAAGITDTLDGYLARKLGQITRLGAFLDPVADKLIVATALVLLVSRDPQALVVLMAIVIIGREIAISALREWMAQIGASKSVAVNSLGKFKTVCQMVAIPMLLFYGPLPFGGVSVDTRVWGLWLIYLAAFLTIWSMLYYMKLAWPQIRERGGVA
jgi:cardiolipin synthase